MQLKLTSRCSPTGDRYIGYDYASKKALAEFLLESPIDSMAASGLPGDTSGGVPLVSSLPVVEILGRQHQVDGVYHDFLTDLVYIFSGMKFYIFGANEFKVSSITLLVPRSCIID